MPSTSAASATTNGRSLKNLLSRGVARVVHHGAWKFRHYECVWSMVQKELGSTVRTPLRARLEMWRRGFISEAWVLYDLEHNDPDLYISDYARFTRSRLVNGRYAAILDNKLLFDQIVGELGPVLPKLLGILENGRMLNISTNEPIGPAADRVLEELHRSGSLILKPLTGGGAHGIMALRYDGDSYTHNGEPIREDDIRRIVDGCSNYMACEFIEQHPTLATIYPHSINSLRLLAMQDEHCEAFIAAAVVRIGTDATAPRENWLHGGLSAKIDIETGLLGKAVHYPSGGSQLTWHAAHPDSGEMIEGVSLPNWEQVKTGVLEIFRALPVLKYVGWDVVVTEDGFRILEGNNYSDVALLQVHGPLMADERVRAFYRRHRVIRD